MEAGLLGEQNTGMRSSLSSEFHADAVILRKDLRPSETDYYADRPLQKAPSLIFSAQELSSVRAEFTCCSQLASLQISDFDSHACSKDSEDSEAHQRQKGATGEERFLSRAELFTFDPTARLAAASSQVHNRFVNSLEQTASPSCSWTQWTDSELNARLEAKYDPLSTLPLPSLSSSSISSVRSQADEIYPISEAFLRNTRLPFMSNKATHCDLYNSPASRDGRLVLVYDEDHPSDTTRERVLNQQLPEWYRIAGPRRNDVDWAQWEPSKYQCNFCKERFLVEFDFRNHLGTHKRHRKHLKRERQQNSLTFGGSYSEISTQDIPRKSLAYAKPVKGTVNDQRSQYSEIDPLGNVNDQGNFEQPTSSTDSIASRNSDAEGGYGSEHKLGASGGTNFDIASTSVSYLRNAHLSTHLRPRNGLAGGPISSNQKMEVYPENIKEVGGNNKLDDSPDTDIFDLDLDAVKDNGDRQLLVTVELTLASTRQKLMNHIMDEILPFWKQNWASVVRTCGTDSGWTTSEAPEPRSRYPSQNSSNNRSRQRNVGDDNSQGNGDRDEDDGDDDQRAPKRPRTSSATLENFNNSTKFACPYRKYDARKYCVRNWRSCALTPLDSVARVKAHLYRHHRIFQCQRCKSLFLNQNILDEHILALEGCKPTRVNVAEGITADVEKRLRSRKKTHPNQTEAERWIEIYQILFPNATSPSPFFEPVEESVEQSSDSAKFAGFEAYTQQELPKIFWAALEEVVTKEMQPVEERIRTQLMGVIQDCQGQVFSTYQSMVNSNLDALLGDTSTRDKLLKQFEPLPQNDPQSNLASTDGPSLRLPRLDDIAESTPNEDNIQDQGSNISAFNSSTTLSSIFDSSKTLSSVFNSSATLNSIASSPTFSSAQPTNSKCPEKITELKICGAGANDNAASATYLQTNDFWATDIEGADLTHFDADWEVEAAAYEI